MLVPALVTGAVVLSRILVGATVEGILEDEATSVEVGERDGTEATEDSDPTERTLEADGAGVTADAVVRVSDELVLNAVGTSSPIVVEAAELVPSMTVELPTKIPVAEVGCDVTTTEVIPVTVVGRAVSEGAAPEELELSVVKTITLDTVTEEIAPLVEIDSYVVLEATVELEGPVT